MMPVSQYTDAHDSLKSRYAACPRRTGILTDGLGDLSPNPCFKLGFQRDRPFVGVRRKMKKGGGAPFSR